ncbi:hypothetical protein [Ancylobacter sp. TS-1]|uniref:hypothetical protein n=1 Tax=Ancylobacter sp. TS-1 TaxID=1850374 RepID=UPI001FEF5C76|nr:hypothetical protein [Ancylobacter sp. TS-1]
MSHARLLPIRLIRARRPRAGGGVQRLAAALLVAMTATAQAQSGFVQDPSGAMSFGPSQFSQPLAVEGFGGLPAGRAASDGKGQAPRAPALPSQALPFVGTPPATGPAAGPRPTTGAAGAITDPHSILPQPPAGKVAIGMSARFGDNEPFIPRGLVWRVFADRPEASGAYPLVAEAADPAPVFFLSPGGYVVHVSYGLASVARRIVVGDESRREQLVVPAGGVTLHSDVNDRPIPTQKVTYDIFEGSFLQGRASTRPYFRGASSGDTIILPAGDYYVVSTYGEGNAVIQADVAVAPGKVTDATLHHRAGEVTMRLVRVAGGEALPETQWSILTPGGDGIKESINSLPVFVLAEGEYTAVARYEGKTYTKEFAVEAGKDGPVEVMIGDQVAPQGIEPQEGSGD